MSEAAAAEAALMEGATATLMYLTTTRVRLTDEQLTRLLALCANGPHRARQFAAAAAWCTVRDVDNCAALHRLGALGNEVEDASTALPTAHTCLSLLHTLLHYAWAWDDRAATLAEEQPTLSTLDWLLATTILLVNFNAGAVLRGDAPPLGAASSALLKVRARATFPPSNLPTFPPFPRRKRIVRSHETSGCSCIDDRRCVLWRLTAGRVCGNAAGPHTRRWQCRWCS